MAGYPSHAGPLDSRWELVEGCDSYGRDYLASRPRHGARFGSRVVLDSRAGKSLVLCDCKDIAIVTNRSLRRGKAGSCRSCSRKGKPRNLSAAAIVPDAKLRATWQHRYSGIISRCYDRSHRAYPNYGERGIRMCDEWRADRLAFLRYATTLPHWDTIGLDLDRIDNDGDYEPGNLRLVSRGENCLNRRNAVIVEFAGSQMSLRDFWLDYCPDWRTPNSVRYHLKRGRTPEWIVARYRATRGRVGPA